MASSASRESELRNAPGVARVRGILRGVVRRLPERWFSPARLARPEVRFGLAHDYVMTVARRYGVRMPCPELIRLSEAPPSPGGPATPASAPARASRTDAEPRPPHVLAPKAEAIDSGRRVPHQRRSDDAREARDHREQRRASGHRLPDQRRRASVTGLAPADANDQHLVTHTSR